MTEEERQKLEFIKKEIKEGDYSILQPNQWDKFSADLAGIGANLLKEIEVRREDARALKVPLFFFKVRERLTNLEVDYDVVAKDYDLFFDASMRFLKSIINRNEYKEYQILRKEYLKSLTEHCIKALEYVGNIVTTGRHDYYHYQILFVAALAILVAIISVIIK